MKTIVWTQHFHCVFSEMKTQTFENVFVWTGLELVQHRLSDSPYFDWKGRDDKQSRSILFDSRVTVKHDLGVFGVRRPAYTSVYYSSVTTKDVKTALRD